jgi:hypothetical protein
VRDHDCGTVAYEDIHRETHKLLFKESFEDKIYGKFLAKDIIVDGKVLVPSETMIDKDMIALFKEK